MNPVSGIGAEFGPYVKMTFPSVDGAQICQVDVTRSPKPVFLAGKQAKEFYIRSGNGNHPLDPEATHDYIEMHRAS